jgi:hypothetical protein
MDKTLLRPLIFEILRRTPQTHLHAIETEIRQKVDGYERSDALHVQEAVWDLLLQGILAPGKNSLNLHLPFVHVTEYGQMCLDEGAIAAHDPDGYITRTRTLTNGAASEAVLETLRDALASFHDGVHRAALVLLSRAAGELLREVQQAGCLPTGACVTAEPVVSELEALVRLARSTTGAIVLPSADRDSVLGRLLIFPDQCRAAYSLIAAREANA